MDLRVENLELVREDGVPLLAPLTLHVASGEQVGLVGESGSGKSLLVQAIFGILPAGVRQTAGCIEAFGVPMDRPSPARDRIRGHRLAWVPQDPLQALNPLLRVQDQLTLLPRVHLGESRSAALRRLFPLLERLRLPRATAFLRRYPDQLSGGQRQRLVLAMSLSCDPELLILDEPTTALDPLVRAEFLALIQELQGKRRLGCFWITHDLAMAAKVTQRLLVLYGGFLVEAGPTSELLKAPRHPYTSHLFAAARGASAVDAGFLPSPGERFPGCPFRPRCPQGQERCTHWGPWRGDHATGYRCEALTPMHSPFIVEDRRIGASATG